MRKSQYKNDHTIARRCSVRKMFVFLILLVSLLLTSYLYAVRHFDYWKKKGIISIKPIPFVGNLGPILFQKCSIAEHLDKIYKEYADEPYVGMFLADKPCLFVKDWDLASRILKQDFSHFNSRILTLSKKTDPIGSRSLFVLHGTEWKNTRTKLSSIFTSKKQKVVLDAMLGVGKKIIGKLNESSTIEMKELTTSVAVDMISDGVLGFEGGAITDPDNDSLRHLGINIFDGDFNQTTRLKFMFLAPEIMELFNLYAFHPSAYNTMRDAAHLALKKKKEQGANRGDFLDAFIEMREKGSWEGNDGEMIIPDDENLVGQLFMFFTAGYETVANGVLFCVYAMATRQDIQDKLRQEYNETLQNNGGKLTYEALHSMKYLDNFIHEVLRRHSPFPFVDRVCNKDYKIPGTNITIDRGTKVLIPMFSLHNDPKYFEDPHTIIPERFDDPEAMKDKPYFPFSTGPRLCLGMRFAIQAMKVTLISCLKGHRLVADKDAYANMRMHPKRFGNTPLHDVMMKVQKLNGY